MTLVGTCSHNNSHLKSSVVEFGQPFSARQLGKINECLTRTRQIECNEILFFELKNLGTCSCFEGMEQHDLFD